MRLVPLFGHFARFQLTNSKKTDILKNIHYGRADNRLDVYIGSPSATSTSLIDHTDDDANSDHTVESNGSPVLIYVYGGAWDSGHKSMLMPMAQNLANQGYIVVVPDYTRYPQAKIEDMVRDIQDAVVWTTKNATRYGGDPSNIYLMGSGSGAHVSSLAIIHDAIEQLGGIPAPDVEGDTTPLVKIPSWPKDEPTEEKGSQNYKERVRGLILFSGVFDITYYYVYLHKRGIEEVSAMPRVMHRSANNYLACSPSWILATAMSTLERPELLEQVLPKSILLIHGEKDGLIPAFSSSTLFNLLCHADIANTKYKIYTGQGHLDPAIDLILPSNPITASLLSDIEDVVRHNSATASNAAEFSSTGSSTPNGGEEDDDLLLKQQQEQYSRDFTESLAVLS
ncbi:Alpha/Beta hydrolase protein [Lobosporangium transversale]|uniref:Alpha/Beta hydrolase protein n=1 Tax=Lobosporangium transversale TaxID=64571 RepID=A0A1Y2H435_9FUNG|nr:Alpha/Beta hydrolase protein [Lobosporangium transversale]ORZ28473.1 Alpha/Beta hydrolase protein [Lobosporangium transversale]|eukprot:XP_021886158.1 Alpha/Beta hydrolase protein [Lobosporangium transversale]